MAENQGGAAGTGTPPPAAGAAPTVTTPAASGNTVAPTEWTSGFSDETRGYVQKKGFKDAGALADSYISLEKLHSAGPDRLLRLPESMEGDEAKAVWERLGKPKEAKDYALKTPEKGDPKFTEWAQDVFHKGNLTSKQASDVQSAWNERMAQVQAQTAENQKTAATLAVTDLKTEWGAAFDKNKNLADQAGKVLGWSDQKLGALAMAVGPKEAMKMLLDIGNSISESKFVGGRPAPDGNITPEQARAELNQLYQDSAWVKRYTNGDFDAKKRMSELQKMANPGEVRLT